MATYTGDFRTLDLVGVFRELGLDLGREVNGKHYVTCPWADGHSGTGKTDTLIWMKPDGPHFHCSHNHCANKHTNDARDWAESVQPGIIDEYCRERFRPEQGGGRLPQAPTRTATKPTVKPFEPPGKSVPLPKPLDVTPARFLEVIHEPEDFVCLTWKDEEGAPRNDVFQYVADWSDIYEGQPGPFSDPEGVYHCINALKGPARTDEQVADYQYCLLEGDAPKGSSPEQIEESKRQQYAFFMECGLPIAAVYDFGGKSIHALVRISAGKDARLFRERADKVYEFAANLPGLDSKNKNPARLSRLPGAYRRDRLQALLNWSVGAKSFQEWEAQQSKEEVQPKADALKGEQDEPEVTQEDLERKYSDSDRAAFPSPMLDAAFYGPLGQLVHALAPHTEASKESLLCHLLVAFGNIVGRTRYLYSGDKHFCNEFLAILGDTAVGRKGTAWRALSEVLKRLDLNWYKTKQLSGVQSGEGIIHAIRDPKERAARTKKEKSEYGDRAIIEDEGIEDKRLMIIEEELSQILTVSKREANTTSEILRQSWDSREYLQNAAKNNGERASNPHVSVIGHSTREEFREKTKNTTAAANGTLNRFLICASRKAQTLADTEYIDWDLPVWRVLLEPIRSAIETISRVGVYEHRVKRDAGAKARWDSYYKAKSREEESSPGGLIGSILARSVAHVARVSLLFAIADGKDIVSEQHQIAAEAVVTYCERSARWVFGILTGRPMADKLIRELRRNPAGLTRTQISEKVFGRSWSAASISDILSDAKQSGYADWKLEQTGGRAAEIWFAK